MNTIASLIKEKAAQGGGSQYKGALAETGAAGVGSRYAGVAKSISGQYAEVLEQIAGRRLMPDDCIKSNPLQQMVEKQSITVASLTADLHERHEQAKRLMFVDYIKAKSLVSQMAEYRGITVASLTADLHEQAVRLMPDDRIKSNPLQQMAGKSASFMANLHEQQKKAIEAACENARNATMKQGFIRRTDRQEQETVEINIPLLPVMRALKNHQPPEPQTKLPAPQPLHTRQRKQQPAADPSDKQVIISAYMSEIGHKGNHSYGATKRQIIEHFIREHRETGISKNQFADRYHKHYNRSRSTVRDILKGVRV